MALVTGCSARGAEIAVVFAAYGAASYSAALCYAQPRRSESTNAGQRHTTASMRGCWLRRFGDLGVAESGAPHRLRHCGKSHSPR